MPTTETWQQEDTKRLKQLFDSKAGDAALGQAEFGKKYGIGKPAMIWQYLHGHRNLNHDVLLKFAKGLRVKPESISPTLVANPSASGRRGRRPLVRRLSALPGADRGVSLTAQMPYATTLGQSKPVEVIRRENLEILIERAGNLANLNRELGRKPKDSTLSQIRNQAIASGTGKPKVMGSAIARNMEGALKLSDGWMDQDHTALVASEKESTVSLALPPTQDRIYLLKEIRLDKGQALQLLRCSEDALQHLALAEMPGDAMVPTLQVGAWILVDKAVQKVTRDGLYVFTYEGALQAKRVQRTPNGLRISSDNPAYASWEIPAKKEDKLRVHGRIVWALNQAVF